MRELIRKCPKPKTFSLDIKGKGIKGSDFDLDDIARNVLLVLHEQGDWTQQQIAKALGISQPAAGRRLAKGRFKASEVPRLALMAGFEDLVALLAAYPGTEDHERPTGLLSEVERIFRSNQYTELASDLVDAKQLGVLDQIAALVREALVLAKAAGSLERERRLRRRRAE